MIVWQCRTADRMLARPGRHPSWNWPAAGSATCCAGRGTNETGPRTRGLADARELREPRGGLVRRFLEFTNEYRWGWTAAHLEEWCRHLTAEERLAASTIRGYQCGLRLFTEFLADGRYGWAAACEQAFGPGQYPVAIA